MNRLLFLPKLKKLTLSLISAISIVDVKSGFLTNELEALQEQILAVIEDL